MNQAFHVTYYIDHSACHEMKKKNTNIAKNSFFWMTKHSCKFIVWERERKREREATTSFFIHLYFLINLWLSKDKKKINFSPNQELLCSLLTQTFVPSIVTRLSIWSLTASTPCTKLWPKSSAFEIWSRGGLTRCKSYRYIDEWYEKRSFSFLPYLTNLLEIDVQQLIFWSNTP